MSGDGSNHLNHLKTEVFYAEVKTRLDVGPTGLSSYNRGNTVIVKPFIMIIRYL